MAELDGPHEVRSSPRSQSSLDEAELLRALRELGKEAAWTRDARSTEELRTSGIRAVHTTLGAVRAERRAHRLLEARVTLALVILGALAAGWWLGRYVALRMMGSH